MLSAINFGCSHEIGVGVGMPSGAFVGQADLRAGHPGAQRSAAAILGRRPNSRDSRAPTLTGVESTSSLTLLVRCNQVAITASMPIAARIRL